MPLARPSPLLVGAITAAAIACFGAGSAEAATIAVTTNADSLADDGLCSLREAVSASNENASVNTGDCLHPGGNGADRINLPAGNLSLTLTGAGENANLTGDLDIDADAGGLTIDGAGEGATTIGGGAADRVFHVLASAAGPVEIQELTITNGAVQGPGGGVLAAGGTLTIDDATVQLCSANGNNGTGGGVSAPGGVTLLGATITENTARTGGGGVEAAFANLRNSTISANELSTAGAGGGILLGSGRIERSTVADNETTGLGGGVAIRGASVNIVTSIIEGNTAGSGGGLAIGFDGSPTAVAVQGSTIAANSAAGNGGGIAVSGDGTLDLSGSVVEANLIPAAQASIHFGAGIRNFGELHSKHSVIADNVATAAPGRVVSGGGIYNGSEAAALIDATLLVGNEVVNGIPSGGGVANLGDLQISNSTLARNAISGANGLGGALSTDAGEVVISYSTFAENKAAGGGGLAIDRSGGEATLSASIIDQPTAFACSGTRLDSLGYNVDRTATCFLPGPGDLRIANPGLLPLARNNGPDAGAPGAQRPLESYAIPVTSHAFDRVEINTCTTGQFAATPDQRGFERPMSNGCDSGAVEVLACAGGTATMVGTPESETITGTPGPDTIQALGGDDTVIGLGGNDRLCGGSGNDEIAPGAGDDSVDGGDANLRGGSSNLISYAGAPGPITLSLQSQTATGEGSDTIIRIDRVVGGPASDFLTGSSGENRIEGGPGNDQLRGLGGPDNMFGEDGDDLLVGGLGSDGLTGGAGLDTIDYSASDAAIFMPVDGFGLADGEGRDFIDGEVIVGSERDDQLVGGEDVANTLLGRGGDDVLVPGSGATIPDTLDGGPGVDTAWFAGLVPVTASPASAVGQGSDALVGIENLQGGDGNDTLTGDALDNFIDGGFGDDTVGGGPGGTDTLSYQSAGAKVAVSLKIRKPQDTGGAGLDLITGGFERLIGSPFADALEGNRKANELVGLAGRDVLLGRGGPDRLHGGRGKDRCDGGRDKVEDEASSCEKKRRIP